MPKTSAEGATREQGKSVGAVENAIAILRYLSRTHDPVGVTKVARDTGINSSTCFNILKTLVNEDFVSFDPPSKAYAISFGILNVALRATALRNDINVVRPLLQSVARKHGVSVSLVQSIGENRKVLVMSASGADTVRLQMAVGQRLPKFVGATGLCFAAFSEVGDKQLKKYFSEMRWEGQFDFAAYKQLVDDTAERGWAIENGHFTRGTGSLAVPIFNNDGAVVMAATATMFEYQVGEKVDDIVPDLLDLGKKISLVLSAL